VHLSANRKCIKETDVSKKRRKSKNRPTQVRSGEQGFEFGFVPRAMYTHSSSFELNRHLTNANVVGCAYGLDHVSGYPAYVPCLTFIAEKPEELLAASTCLESWGCAEDGDAVDINIILKSDGGYLISMQPNWRRTLNRVVKDDALVDLLAAGATWIKTIDSTNPVLRKWKEYLRSKIAPIKVGFATAKFVDGLPRFDNIEAVPDALSFVKFGVTIETEEEKPDHRLLEVAKGERGRRRRPDGVEKWTPRGVATARANVIDSAFPISRVRIRRARMTERVSVLANTNLGQSQVEQAAINLGLSKEWTGGESFYVGIEKLETEWWKRVRCRVEVAGMDDPLTNIDPTVVLHQLTLDVEHTLRQHGAAISPKFHANLKLFNRLGYA
jgi:hypothetical protein